MSEHFSTKLHIEKEGESVSKELAPGSEELHPGVINAQEQLDKLNIENEPWLKHPNDNI